MNEPFTVTTRIAKGLTASFTWDGSGVINCEWNPAIPDTMTRQMRNRYDNAMQAVSNLIQAQLKAAGGC